MLFLDPVSYRYWSLSLIIGLASDCLSVCLRVELWPLKLSPQLNPILRQAVASFEHDLSMASIRLKLALCGLVMHCMSQDWAGAINMGNYTDSCQPRKTQDMLQWCGHHQGTTVPGNPYIVKGHVIPMYILPLWDPSLRDIEGQADTTMLPLFNGACNYMQENEDSGNLERGNYDHAHHDN